MTKTPMMQQYDRAKEACGDAILLFRMGDFYELFHDDAKIAAKLLGMTLTSRDKGPNAIPMAGFPHHQLDAYMAKLIKQGFRVAVCDQVENPKKAKGLVKREIRQVVTPGTVTDSALLDPNEATFLAAVFELPRPKSKSKKVESSTQMGLSWAEISTGRFYVTVVEPEQLPSLLARIAPREVLVADRQQQSLLEGHPNLANQLTDTMVTVRPDWSFSAESAVESLLKQFQVATLDGYGVDQFGENSVCAAGAILEYIKETQKASLQHFDRLLPFRQSQFVEIDAATWRSLEVSRTIRANDREGSLLGVIDRSVTPMGSRMMGDWFANPLTKKRDIEARHDAIEEFTDQPLRNGVREYLGNVYDLQRLLARVATGRTSPRDLNFIVATLAQLPALKAKLAGRKSKLLSQLESELDLCAELRSELETALVDPAPAQAKDGGFIKDGFDKKLDELRGLCAGGKKWIAEYQQTICNETGIPSLKVGYNRVFGYYLEVTHAHREKVPENFIRKQTLKNAERYITPELKEYEEKVLSADTKALELETEILDGLRELVQAHTVRLKTNAEIIATLDTLAALAQLAVDQNYCRPTLAEDNSVKIVGGRHPVLDILQPLGAFVPNDTTIDDESGFLHLITGPNMAGKSTYIRQVALIALMAQAGSFVPAKSAHVGLVDRIFARVGASDELTRGQSTFMVEMTETARILNTATGRSLVILDEIGRGTSTYDGVSLAWAIVEYLHDQIGCRTLFATHYHELTDLSNDLKGVSNYNVSVKEWDEKIVFLHTIVPGGADKSYGIQVARLAGVPDRVNHRAEDILERLESNSDLEANRSAIRNDEREGARSESPENSKRRSSSASTGEIQLTMFGTAEHPLLDKIREADLNSLTPIQALQMLSQWQADLVEDQVPSSRRSH